jgi:hypothetical protein
LRPINKAIQNPKTSQLNKAKGSCESLQYHLEVLLVASLIASRN